MTSDEQRNGRRELTHPAVRINLRPLAGPLPLGLYSFGIGMMVIGAQTAGWIPVRQDLQVGLVIASFVFPLELLAVIFGFLARDTLAVTVLGLFTTSWLTQGLALILGPPGVPSVTLGFFLMAFSAVIYVTSLVAISGKPLLGLIMFLSASRGVLDGLFQFTGTHGVALAAGIVATVIAGLALYSGTAFLMEELRHRAILPVFRRGNSATAIQGQLSDQLLPATAEAGVREQL
ncbi:MAG TPA: GPR1/FUN34/YaaH family transporter [Solirubrobacteraceae bacterium]|jgi:hypothetical protein|nr:GPR1/FUN34/YaaH family transporter [Solirubrobacteraceae bacterium]